MPDPTEQSIWPEDALKRTIHEQEQQLSALGDHIDGQGARIGELERGVRCEDCDYWTDDRIGADWGTCSHKDQRPFMPPVCGHKPCTMAPSRWKERT